MADLPQRRLPDDVLEYILIPSLPEGLEESEYIPLLEGYCDSYLGFLGPLIIDYIWQNEGFNLRPVAAKGEVPAHLYGSTNFGDNIEDEWFIIHLLYELSKCFPDLVIRVCDNDEEFLLIEAADHLPGWLNPESAEKRVYIHGGELHVVPIPQNPSEVSALPLFTPTVQEAVALVRNTDINTTADHQIQEALNRRLVRCQESLKENDHYANLYVPVTVAAVLKDRPALVSPAVQAFYYRDPVEMKACRTMNYFKPENMVVTRVRFTRCLYAQLLQQKFQPDKRSGWTMVSSSNPKYKEQDLGMKLTHGFEILCSRCKGSTNGSTTESGADTCGPSDIRWTRFVQSLKDKGYFKGELEGSQMYNTLLEDAKKFFQAQLSHAEQSWSDVARDIVLMLPSVNMDVGPWKQQEKALPPSDDDSWIDLTAEMLEEMMRSASGVHGDVTNPEVNLQNVADTMAAFVGKVSSADGVEFPSPTKEGGDEVELDETSFIHAMQKMFEFKDDEGSSSDMSEYDWDEDSDDDLGSPTKMAPPGTRPAVPAARSSAHKQPRTNTKLSASTRTATKNSKKSTENSSTSSSKTTNKHSANQSSQPSTEKPSSEVRQSHYENIPSRSTASPARPTSKPPERPAKPPAVPLKPPSRPSKPPSRRKDPEIVAIMDAMDRELAATEVGKSFEREPPRPKPPKFQPKARPEQNGRRSDTAARTTSTTTTSSTPSKLVSRPSKPPNPPLSRPSKPPNPPPSRPSRPPPPVPGKPSAPQAEDEGVDIDDEDDDFCPVNIDVNVVKNTLESFKAQQGLAGPVSNILQSMGIVLPPDTDTAAE